MFNEGDSIISKKNILNIINGYFKLTKGKKYVILHKYMSLDSIWFSLQDDTENIKDFSLQEMNKHFYTMKEIRKEKINKIEKS